MAYCTNCGTQMEGQFCPKCGAAATAAAHPNYNAPAPPLQGGLSINTASALCYSLGFVTGVVFLVLAPYNQERRVRFHAFQSILLSVATVVIHVGITILSLVFHTFSFSLGLMVSSLHLLVSLGFFLIWLYMMWKSYQGVMVVLPVIGAIAERQAGQDASTGTGGTMGRAA